MSWRAHSERNSGLRSDSSRRAHHARVVDAAAERATEARQHHGGRALPVLEQVLLGGIEEDVPQPVAADGEPR